MVSQHVLRIRRTDTPTDHPLLVNVTQTSKSRPLDLKLVATDREHLYHASIKSSNLVALQASKYNGDEDEWKQVLACALLQERSDHNLNALQSLEVVAAVNGETCTLTLRNNIGGITSRLGAIKFVQNDEEEEVSMFDWVDTAVAASDELRSALATLHVSCESQQAQVAKLTAQLDELVKAKREHEEQLLRKFAVLLDSKKAKIREQQRELNSMAKSHGHQAGTSSRGKRKAIDPSSDLEDNGEAAEDDAEDDELEAEDEEGQQTPEQVTDDEGSDDGGFAAPTRAAPGKATSSSTQERLRSDRAVGKGASVKEGGMVVDVEDMPPRRELPFTRRKPQDGEAAEQEGMKKAAPAPVPEEDDSDDDEL